MKDYQHLLLPTDLTEASEPAATRAKMMARVTGAELTILHIVDYVPPRWIANELPEEFGSEVALIERAQEHLSTWMKNHQLQDHHHRVLTGSPKRIIIDVAKEIPADLIIMGTHGDRGIARIVGSTARAVLHDAPCDVLVVHMG